MKIHSTHTAKTKSRLFRPVKVVATALGGFALLSVLYLGYFQMTQDTQCRKSHKTENHPPTQLQSAQDYFDQANYDYDIGDCAKASFEYTIATQKKSDFAEAYNNLGYTYMRMNLFNLAEPNFDAALKIRPDYVNALINRGDLHSFYYGDDRKKGIPDYDKVIALGKAKETNVCVHRARAVAGKNIIKYLWIRLTRPADSGC